MINYFKQLLATLKSIDASLKELSVCVRHDHHGHGDRHSISTKHWND
jgi:hypothetical protein